MSKLESTIWSVDGKKAGSIALPEEVFGVSWNADLVSQVVNSILSSQRKNVAHTKSRAEVAGGGKKPWQQKGTGRARHGSIRSPIWVGGGVAHGPRNDKNFERKVSKKMKTKALYTLLSRKLKDGEVLFVDALSLSEGKTKRAIETLKSLGKIEGYDNMFGKRKNAIAIALSDKNKPAENAFRNLGNVEAFEARNLNPVTILKYKYLVIENPDVSIKALPKIAKSRKSAKAAK